MIIIEECERLFQSSVYKKKSAGSFHLLQGTRVNVLLWSTKQVNLFADSYQYHLAAYLGMDHYYKAVFLCRLLNIVLHH